MNILIKKPKIILLIILITLTTTMVLAQFEEQDEEDSLESELNPGDVMPPARVAGYHNVSYTKTISPLEVGGTFVSVSSGLSVANSVFGARIRADSGSVSNPAYGFSGGGSSKGMFSLGDDLRFVTNGNTRLTINPSGYVGIGTDPTQALHVRGNIALSGGSGGRFIGTLDNRQLFLRTNNINRVTITNTGNVGIGVNHPSAKLEVAGDAKVSNALITQEIFVEKQKICYGRESSSSDAVTTLLSPQGWTINNCRLYMQELLGVSNTQFRIGCLNFTDHSMMSSWLDVGDNPTSVPAGFNNNCEWEVAGCVPSNPCEVGVCGIRFDDCGNQYLCSCSSDEVCGPSDIDLSDPSEALFADLQQTEGVCVADTGCNPVLDILYPEIVPDSIRGRRFCINSDDGTNSHTPEFCPSSDQFILQISTLPVYSKQPGGCMVGTQLCENFYNTYNKQYYGLILDESATQYIEGYFAAMLTGNNYNVAVQQCG